MFTCKYIIKVQILKNFITNISNLCAFYLTRKNKLNFDLCYDTSNVMIEINTIQSRLKLKTKKKWMDHI